MDTKPCAIVPIEVVLDQRLRLPELRLLVALLSFPGVRRAEGARTPAGEVLARCGLLGAEQRLALAGLEQAGWVQQMGADHVRVKRPVGVAP